MTFSGGAIVAWGAIGGPLVRAAILAATYAYLGNWLGPSASSNGSGTALALAAALFLLHLAADAVAIAGQGTAAQEGEGGRWLGGSDADDGTQRTLLLQWWQAVPMLVNGFLFLATAERLLTPEDRVWSGALAIGLAAVHAALARLALLRGPGTRWAVRAAVAASMVFTARFFQIQFDGIWVALAWAMQGFGLWWFGDRVRSASLHALGAALLVFSAGRVVLVDTLNCLGQQTLPVLNAYALAGGAVVVLSLLAARRPREKAASRVEPGLRVVLYGVGGTLAGLVASKEAFQVCQRFLDPRDALGVVGTGWLVLVAAFLAARYGSRLRGLGRGATAAPTVVPTAAPTEAECDWERA